MSPRETNATSARRRPSLSFRPRPRTAGHAAPMSKELALDTLEQPYLMEVCQDDHVPAVEEIDPFPNAAPRRHGAKSFSSLKHPVDGLVALGRRLSVSLRHKPSKQAIPLAEDIKLVDDDEDRYYHHSSHANHKRVASGSWDVRSTKPHWHQGYSVNRRPSLNSVSALHSFYAPTASIPAPIPGRGQAPPVLPNHKSAGAAARAAAAAQNEQMEAARVAKAELENKLLDLRVPQDSESGICIDMRDRSDVSDPDLMAMMRLGKDEPLPRQRACFANLSFFQIPWPCFRLRLHHTFFHIWTLIPSWTRSLCLTPGFVHPLLMFGGTYSAMHMADGQQATQPPS